MKKFGVILYSLLCILLLGACKEDEYVYPNVITTFIDAATDESGTLQKLITDKGESLQILNREGLDGLTLSTEVYPSMNRKNRQMRDKRLPCSIPASSSLP